MTAPPAVDVLVRPGRPDDWRALRMLLPDAVHFGCGVTPLVAAAGVGGPVVAAAVLGPHVRGDPVPGLPVALRITPPVAGRGVERMLLDSAERVARGRGLHALYGWGLIPAGGETEAAWRRLGFDRAVEVIEGRSDIATALAFLEPAWERVSRRRPPPADVVVRPLDRAEPAAIARLYAEHIGGSADKVLAELTGRSPNGFDPALSPIVYAGDTIAACVLTRRPTPDEARIEAVIVTPGFRNGWANLLVRREGWRWGQRLGVKTIVFYTHDRHADTRRFVEKIGTSTRRMVEPYRVF